MASHGISWCLEEHHTHLSDVEVAIALVFVRDMAGKVASDQAMPGGAELQLELLLEIRSNVLFKVVVLHGVPLASC